MKIWNSYTQTIAGCYLAGSLMVALNFNSWVETENLGIYHNGRTATKIAQGLFYPAVQIGRAIHSTRLDASQIETQLSSPTQTPIKTGETQ